jgi:hypothetical protein
LTIAIEQGSENTAFKAAPLHVRMSHAVQAVVLIDAPTLGPPLMHLDYSAQCVVVLWKAGWACDAQDHSGCRERVLRAWISELNFARNEEAPEGYASHTFSPHVVCEDESGLVPHSKHVAYVLIVGIGNQTDYRVALPQGRNNAVHVISADVPESRPRHILQSASGEWKRKPASAAHRLQTITVKRNVLPHRRCGDGSSPHADLPIRP